MLTFNKKLDSEWRNKDNEATLMGNLPSVEISTLETQSLVLTEAHTSPTC